MRKLIFFGFIALGIGVGLFATVNNGWGIKIVMSGVGALFGTVIGGALSRIGRKRLRPSKNNIFHEPSATFGNDEILDRYWHDAGRLPLSPPSSHGHSEFSGSSEID